MRQLAMPLRRILLQVLLLLALYFLSRLAFTLLNHSHFEGLSLGGFLRLAFHALRYDLSAICAINALYFLLVLLPLPVWRWPRWERFTQVVFVVINCIALLFEIDDWVYFPYNFKRSTADVLRIISRKGDFWNLLPDYILIYWYIPLCIAGFVFVFIKANNWIRNATPLRAGPGFEYKPLLHVWQVVLLLLVMGFSVVGVRGGLQYIPIGLRNAVQVTDSRYVPIVVNTPFSILTTWATPGLEEVAYLPETKATQLMPFRHQYSGKPFSKKNVVFIILESGSKEFTALGGTKSYTPFLDSLMGLGLTCTQGFANGQTSAEGIPAILAGIPTLMDEAFTTSNYGTNRITALPGVLRAQGYGSAFYHGGTNGTMSFDIFSSAAGFDNYYGRKEYGNEKDYDGAWGIWDEPFLQYFAKGLSQMKQPFCASVFTLAAHPPYNLPDAYRNTLPAGPLPVYQCMAYTDMAVRKFFATAAEQPWYDSTLFIITADHTSPQNSGGFYKQGMGLYAIPILFYCPGDISLRGYYNEPVQQLDILPSTLQYLGYAQPFFAFGNSLFEAREQRFVLTHNSGYYQWLQGGYLLQYAGDKARGLYAYPADSMSQTNLIRRPLPAKDGALQNLQAFIQRYRHALIHNEMQ